MDRHLEKAEPAEKQLPSVLGSILAIALTCSLAVNYHLHKQGGQKKTESGSALHRPSVSSTYQMLHREEDALRVARDLVEDPTEENRAKLTRLLTLHNVDVGDYEHDRMNWELDSLPRLPTLQQ